MRRAGQGHPVGDLVISHAWTRARRGGQGRRRLLTIENKGAAADRLVSGETPAAGKLEIHEMSVSDGVMKMRPITVASRSRRARGEARAGGYHLMLIDLKKPLKAGDKVPVTLNFEKAGKVTVSLGVQGSARLTTAEVADP